MTKIKVKESVLRSMVSETIENQTILLGESKKRNTIKKIIKESTDQDRYEDVVFLQGKEADEALSILNNEGQDAALNYLKQWHDFGNHMGMQDLGNGSSDQTYEKDGYHMAWNTRIGYIGLAYDLQHSDDEQSNNSPYPEDIEYDSRNDYGDFSESKIQTKTPIKEGVARNIPKIEKYVNQINELIAQAVDSDGDKIGVIDPTGTWEEPFTYDPIIYQNGALKIVSYSPHSNQGKPNVDIIRSRDMEYDGVPTLQLISRMFKKAIKNKDKYSNVNPDMVESKINEGFEELIPVAAGTVGVFLASAGVSEVMNALQQGKLGDKGQKLAKFLQDLSRTANKKETFPNR